MVSENKDDCEQEADFIDPDTVCGFVWFKPKWLQKMATSRMYLLCYCISNLVLGTYYNYFVGMISTLEKRYAFSTKVSGSLLLAEEIVPLFLNIIIGYFGGKTHRPRLISLGIFLAAFCCFFTSIPYFVYGSAKIHVSYDGIKNGTGIEVCDNEANSVSSCEDGDKPSKMFVVGLLVLANFLRGFSNVTINTIAVPYLDDNSKKKSIPIYLGISMGVRMFGPLFGYLLSSASLSYYENPFEDPGYGPEDPRWVGAWWIGFLIQGVLLVICAVPIGLFPRRLPGFAFPGETLVQTDNQGQVKSHTDENFKDLMFGLFYAMKRILKNPIFLLMIFLTSMMIFSHGGHGVMMPKYFEIQFRVSASDANLYSGATSIAVIMVSTLLGGLFVWKFKPNKKFLIIGTVVTEFFYFAGMLFLMLPRCQPMEMMNYGKSNEGLLILNGSCNENCGCSTSAFTPYCGSDGNTLFFSPCFAGCSQDAMSTAAGNTKKVYSNCSCVPEKVDEIVEGYCADETCWNQALIYICIYLTMLFSSTFLNVFETVLVLRSVDPKDKSVAVGTLETTMSLFGFTPFPVVYGALVDSTCLVWEKSCDTTGNCWFYDMEFYNYLLHGVSAIFIFFGVFGFICMYFFRDRIRDLYEEEVCDSARTNSVKQDIVINSETNL